MGYRQHLRTVVGASAAPYGYTLTLWTSGAVTTHANGVPAAGDALLLLVGAVAAFAVVGAIAFGGVHRVLTPGSSGEVRVWGGVHVPSVGASILLAWVLTEVLSDYLVWLLVGFGATATYLLVLAAQFRLASTGSADRDAGGGDARAD